MVFVGNVAVSGIKASRVQSDLFIIGITDHNGLVTRLHHDCLINIGEWNRVAVTFVFYMAVFPYLSNTIFWTGLQQTRQISHHRVFKLLIKIPA